MRELESRAPALVHRKRIDAVVNEDELDRWQSDGGTIPEVFGDEVFGDEVFREVDDREDAPCVPPLPLGYHAQPAWGFRDRTGRLAYEFHRVYGPPERHDERPATCRLDRDLSYWSVTWPTFGPAGDERAAGTWMTYAQARALWGSRLTFERFSSSIQMRQELPKLLFPVVGADP